MRIIKSPLFSKKSSFDPQKEIIRGDLIKFGITEASRKAVGRLSRYPLSQYLDFLDLLKNLHGLGIKFERIDLDPAKKVAGINLKDLEMGFLRSCVDFPALDLTNLRDKLAGWKKQRTIQSFAAPLEIAEPSPGRSSSGAGRSSPEISIPGASQLLTEDKLLDPAKLDPEHPYPTSPKEYAELVKSVTDEYGKFPGDEQIFSPVKYFARRELMKQGVRVYFFNRGDYNLTAVFFDPRKHASGFMNGLIFDADLLSQSATFGAKKVIGCSYDRVPYYENRFFNSDVVGFVYWDGMPVSFASVSKFSTEHEKKTLEYAFVHFIMTIGRFQRMGLSSYIVTEILSRMHIHKLLHLEGKNLFRDEEEKLRNNYLTGWVAGHTGSIPAGHSFMSSLNVFDPRIERSQDVVKAIVTHADRQITPNRGKRKLDSKTPYAWRDEGVYPEKNSYRKGQIPEKERQLHYFPQVFEILGGVEGLRNGNSAFYVGVGGLKQVSASKRREREKWGGGSLERALDLARGGLVERFTKGKN